MVKFAYNACCGNYKLSPEGVEFYNMMAEQIGLPLYFDHTIKHGTEDIIYLQTIEILGADGTDGCCPQIHDIDDNFIVGANLDSSSQTYYRDILQYRYNIMNSDVVPAQPESTYSNIESVQNLSDDEFFRDDLIDISDYVELIPISQAISLRSF